MAKSYGIKDSSTVVSYYLIQILHSSVLTDRHPALTAMDKLRTGVNTNSAQNRNKTQPFYIQYWWWRYQYRCSLVVLYYLDSLVTKVQNNKI